VQLRQAEDGLQGAWQKQQERRHKKHTAGMTGQQRQLSMCVQNKGCALAGTASKR
jgi:hypothetical protein